MRNYEGSRWVPTSAVTGVKTVRRGSHADVIKLCKLNYDSKKVKNIYFLFDTPQRVNFVGL